MVTIITMIDRMHSDLKKCRGSAHSVGGIHYRNTQAEEQPLTWNNPQGALLEVSCAAAVTVYSFWQMMMMMMNLF